MSYRGSRKRIDKQWIKSLKNNSRITPTGTHKLLWWQALLKVQNTRWKNYTHTKRYGCDIWEYWGQNIFKWKKKNQTSHIQKTSSQNDVVISTETLEAYKQTSKIILSLTQNYPTKQTIIKNIRIK